MRQIGHPAALVFQDGIERAPIPWGAFDAVFIGGSTDWKLSPAVVRLCQLAHDRGKWVHVGRVNSGKRYRWARDEAGADSVDGTFLAFGPEYNLRRLLSWLS